VGVAKEGSDSVNGKGNEQKRSCGGMSVCTPRRALSRKIRCKAKQVKEGKVRSVKKDERKEGICFVAPPPSPSRPSPSFIQCK
jgi:hypothetical protein